MNSFPPAPLHENEEERVLSLLSYDILDTEEEENYHSLALLASRICQTPIAAISLIDKDRQWFKSVIGLKTRQLPRENSLCQYSLLRKELTVIEDTLKDELFKENPLVINKPNIRFYAGMPFFSSDGYPIGTLCVMGFEPKKLTQEQRETLITISRQVTNNMELRKLSFQLKNEPEKVTDEAIRETKRQLREKEIEAKKAMAAKDNFLANMSHEVRTPLNAIIGFSDLLKKSELNPDQCGYVNAISTAGKNLLGIANDILDLSKIESGRFSLESEPFQPDKVFEQIKETFQNSADEKKLKLFLKIDSRLPQWLLGDKHRLKQILDNLVGNAIKFTEDGFVSIEVQPDIQDDGTVNLKVNISDSGIGISEDKISVIFDTFTQADANSTRRFGGTGLGLSIVGSLVENYNGTIDVKSKPGEGSSFYLNIPFQISENPIDAAHQAQAHQNRVKANILVCEDNLLNQKLIHTVLENLGHSAFIANNGKEGVERLKNEIPDLVIMDLQMPEMDGYQATKYIRTKLKLNVPILAMTVGSLAGEKEKCLQTGMDDYLAKPFKEVDLDEKIQHLISNFGYTSDIKSENSDTPSGDFDLSELQILAHGNATMMQEMIGLFKEQTSAQLDDLEIAVQETNYEQIQSISHNLKSSYSLIGFKNMDLIKTLEIMAKDADSKEKIYESVLQLKSETEKVVKQINKAF